MDEKIERAIRLGDSNSLKKALAESKDPLARNDKGLTPLHLVARENGNVEVGRVLLEACSDINARDLDEAGTPLIYASEANHPDFVEFLLSSGADVSLRDNGGKDAMMFASYWADVRAVESLLAHGADMKRVEGNGLDAICFAARGGNLEVLKALLSHGADKDHVDRYGNTLVHQAAWFNHENVVEYLLSLGLDKDARNKVQWTPLMKAMDANSPETVKLLFSVGAETEGFSTDYVNAIGAGRFSDAKEAVEMYVSLKKEALGGGRRFSDEELTSLNETIMGMIGKAVVKDKDFKGKAMQVYRRFFKKIGTVTVQEGDESLEYLWEEDDLHLLLTVENGSMKPIELKLWY